MYSLLIVTWAISMILMVVFFPILIKRMHTDSLVNRTSKTSIKNRKTITKTLSECGDWKIVAKDVSPFGWSLSVVIENKSINYGFSAAAIVDIKDYGELLIEEVYDIIADDLEKKHNIPNNESLPMFKALNLFEICRNVDNYNTGYMAGFQNK